MLLSVFNLCRIKSMRKANLFMILSAIVMLLLIAGAVYYFLLPQVAPPFALDKVPSSPFSKLNERNSKDEPQKLNTVLDIEGYKDNLLRELSIDCKLYEKGVDQEADLSRAVDLTRDLLTKEGAVDELGSFKEGILYEGLTIEKSEGYCIFVLLDSNSEKDFIYEKADGTFVKHKLD